MAEPAEPTARTPVCYRHPGRETYVRCGRCERYICPDDMVSASVGFQCPECVRAGNKNVREPRTVAGGVVRADAGTVTIAIIAINVVLFLAVQGSAELLDKLSLRPFWFTADGGADHGVAQGGWYRLITGAFMHQQTLHIAMNMLMLYLFGRPLEAALGRSRFIAMYLVCALGGSTASYLFLSPLSGSIGASGAIFGLVGALVIMDRQTRSNPSGVVIYLGILLLPGFVVANIDWRGHVGGLVTGAVLGTLFAYAPAANRKVWHVGGMVLVTVVLLVAVQLRTDRLQEQVQDSRVFGLGVSAVVPNVDESCGELQPCHFGLNRMIRVSATASRR